MEKKRKKKKNLLDLKKLEILLPFSVLMGACKILMC